MAKLLLLLLFIATSRLSFCQKDFQSTEDAAEDPGERELVERALTSLESLELRRELEDLQSDSLAEAEKREEGVGFPEGEDQQTPRQSREEEMGFPANEERRSEGETDTYQGSLPEDDVKTGLYRRLEELSEDVYHGVEDGENINDDTDEPVGANPAKRGWRSRRFTRSRRSGGWMRRRRGSRGSRRSDSRVRRRRSSNGGRRSGSRVRRRRSSNGGRRSGSRVRRRRSYNGGRRSGGRVFTLRPLADYGDDGRFENSETNGAQDHPNYSPPHDGAYDSYPPQGEYYANPNIDRPCVAYAHPANDG
ncbi:hypothetical protein ACOMHN_010955 [Nucella lapillus]